ncbi:hypothetical protein NG827_09450 [Xanthomonas sacchari]|uniref:hypothetical protein n=1 Tax=Xanthomonas TaxID=338 RepID=UPI0012FEE8BA|nr:MULTISPECIES: hypothetical protein [Xanthomonas]UYK86601.1 hypothetical protein NG827_09450 [Xanthomonas sacchari]
MDLYAFEQKTVASAAVGDLVFADEHWRLKVEIPNDGKYLLNLTGELNSPLWKVDDNASDICVGLAKDFQWFPHGDVTTGKQVVPRHLSIAITEIGPIIAAVFQGNYLFFSTAGSKTVASKRGTLSFINWSIHVRDTRDLRSWQLVQIGPPAAEG